MGENNLFVSEQWKERGDDDPMTTYCVLCRAEIPADRQLRRAVTCCPEHQREYRRQRRSQRATRFCRLCGRPQRRKSNSEPVLMGHANLMRQGQDK